MIRKGGFLREAMNKREKMTADKHKHNFPLKMIEVLSIYFFSSENYALCSVPSGTYRPIRKFIQPMTTNNEIPKIEVY